MLCSYALTARKRHQSTSARPLTLGVRTSHRDEGRFAASSLRSMYFGGTRAATTAGGCGLESRRRCMNGSQFFHGGFFVCEGHGAHHTSAARGEWQYFRPSLALHSCLSPPSRVTAIISIVLTSALPSSWMNGIDVASLPIGCHFTLVYWQFGVQYGGSSIYP